MLQRRQCIHHGNFMIPTLIIDNFFKNPEKIVDLCKTCAFDKAPKGEWPGVRSNLLSEINFDLFNLFHIKIFALMYPNFYEEIYFNASTFFQKINGKKYPHDGWVHQDASQFTAILYLSNHTDCGTSLWEPKTFQKPIHTEKKRQFYLDQISKEEALVYLKENNNAFNKTLTVQSKFNRLLVFDSKSYHSAEKFHDIKCKEDRITLISFINSFHSPTTDLKNPLLECMRCV